MDIGCRWTGHCHIKTDTSVSAWSLWIWAVWRLCWALKLTPPCSSQRETRMLEVTFKEKCEIKKNNSTPMEFFLVRRKTERQYEHGVKMWNRKISADELLNSFWVFELQFTSLTWFVFYFWWQRVIFFNKIVDPARFERLANDVSRPCAWHLASL